MSAPFGGHPTLAQYLAWAQGLGCRIHQGVATREDGKPCSLTLVENPENGRWLHIIDIQHGDYLVPTEIGYFDRRLGLKSPYFSLPPN